MAQLGTRLAVDRLPGGHLMTYLYWTFDWNAKRAHAASDRGTYVIEGDDHQCWTARFRRTNDGTDVLTRDGTKHSREFTSLSDALRACQRHCEQVASSASSGRFTAQTPPAGSKPL